MKRVLGRVLSVVATAVIATTLTPACAENDKSIFTQMALAPPQQRQNGACTYTNDPSQASLFEGVVDVAARDTYSATLLIGNQLLGRGDTLNGRAESNRVHLNGAIVRVTDANGAELGEFTASAMGFVDAQTANAPAYGTVSVTAIDGPTLKKLGTIAFGESKLVLANIKVFGKTLGGVDVESGEFQLPVRACNGCLISFAGGDDPAAQGVDCNLPLGGAAGGATDVVLPCTVGQDESTPCQLCQERPACRTR